MGHTDVVPVNPDGWRHDPFGGELIDGEVWGRGAVDMLNLTASMAVATKRLARERVPAQGHPRLPRRRRRGGPRHARAPSTSSSTRPTPSGPTTSSPSRAASRSELPTGLKLPVIVGEKGSHWATLRVSGTPGHGSQPYRTDNALVTAAAVVRRLAEYRAPHRDP